MVYRLFAIILTLAGFSFAALAQTEPLHYQIAYQFRDVKNGIVTAQHNEEQYMMPGSVNKVLSTYSAIKILGLDYKFTNKVFISGDIDAKSGVLNGDLILHFDGNPDFTDANIDEIMQELQKLGIKKIVGHIILDHSLLDYHYYASGVESDNNNFCYQAPNTPHVVNKNCVRLDMVLKANNVSVNAPDFMPIDITANVMLTPKASRLCELELTYLEHNQYRLHGCHNPTNTLPTLRIAVRNPQLLWQNWLSYYAAKYALDLSSASLITMDYAMHGDEKLVYQFNSRPLKLLLNDVLFNSDNMVTDMIFKAMGRQEYSSPGSFPKGVEVVNSFLTTIGIDGQNFYIVDGSGLSRKNLHTVAAENTLLLKMWQDTAVREVLKQSLLIAGPEGRGHLSNKLNTSAQKYKILAKTGTLTGVYALTGYLMQNDEPVKVFTIMLNNFPGNKSEALGLMDQIIDENA